MYYEFKPIKENEDLYSTNREFIHPLNRFNVNKLFSDELERVLPEDAHERLSGRLTVSLTHVASMKNVLVDEFDSRADLIDAVVCSCFIPGFSAYEVPTYKVSKSNPGVTG